MTRVTINGLGRIGRATLKILLQTPGLELAAVNDLNPGDNLAYLIGHDSVYGRYPQPVVFEEDMIRIAEKRFNVFSRKDPSQLPSVEAVNDLLRTESQSDRYSGIFGVTQTPIVSSDIIGDQRASIADLTMTQVADQDLVKIMSWYDNETGYSAQMVREAIRISEAM